MHRKLGNALDGSIVDTNNNVISLFAEINKLGIDVVVSAPADALKVKLDFDASSVTTNSFGVMATTVSKPEHNEPMVSSTTGNIRFTYALFKAQVLNSKKADFLDSLKILAKNKRGAALALGKAFLSTLTLFIADILSNVITFNTVMFFIANLTNTDFQMVKNGLQTVPSSFITTLSEYIPQMLTTIISIYAVIVGSLGDALDMLVGDLGEKYLLR